MTNIEAIRWIRYHINISDYDKDDELLEALKMAIEALKTDDMYYYWFDTDYNYGDFCNPKWALFRGEYDENRKKDRTTEEVILWGAWDDFDGDDEEHIDVRWDDVDNYIERTLGFLPEYEVN